MSVSQVVTGAVVGAAIVWAVVVPRVAVIDGEAICPTVTVAPREGPDGQQQLVIQFVCDGVEPPAVVVPNVNVEEFP